MAAILGITHDKLLCTSMYVYSTMLKEVFQKWMVLVNVAMYVQNRTLHDKTFYRQIMMEIKITDDLNKTVLQDVLVLTEGLEKWEKDNLDIQERFEQNWGISFNGDGSDVLEQVNVLINMTLGLGELDGVLQDILREMISEHLKQYEEHLELLVAIDEFDNILLDEYMEIQD